MRVPAGQFLMGSNPAQDREAMMFSPGRINSSIMEYLDFELEIQPGSGPTGGVGGHDYPVAVLHSPAGEDRAVMRFPFDQSALESRLKDLQIALLQSGGKRRRILSAEERVVQDFGRELFEAAFNGPIGRLYAASREHSHIKGKGLRVRLRIQAPELAKLPWEYLYDAERGEYVCLSANTSLVRYLELPQPVQGLKVAPPLRILGLIANPSDLGQLDVEQEKACVEQAVETLRHRGLVELTWLKGQSLRDLQVAMWSGPWHVLHFVGHGDFDPEAEEGVIALVGHDGRAEYLQAMQLSMLLRSQSTTLRLVVLNACGGASGGVRDVFSSTAATLVHDGIPTVLAMQYVITDRAAIEFARGFYAAVTTGLPVDAAVTEARRAVRVALAHSVEWGIPSLYMRASDGILFAVEDQEGSGSEQVRGAGAKTVAGKAEEPSEQQAQVQLRVPASPAAQKRQSSAGSLMITTRLPVAFVPVPSGSFLMGSDPLVDRDAFPDETPQRNISTPGFEIGKYPITNRQYEAFVRETNQSPPRYWDRGVITPYKKEHPVVGVSWWDAHLFCDWLSQRTGADIHLPSEVEWEKAARGFDSRIYPWDDRPPTAELCNFANNVGDTDAGGELSRGPQPVPGFGHERQCLGVDRYRVESS